MCKIHVFMSFFTICMAWFSVIKINDSIIIDMTFTHEGNKTCLDGLVNFEKMHMLAQTTRTIRYCRSRHLGKLCYYFSNHLYELYFAPCIICSSRQHFQFCHKSSDNCICMHWLYVFTQNWRDPYLLKWAYCVIVIPTLASGLILLWLETIEYLQLVKTIKFYNRTVRHTSSKMLCLWTCENDHSHVTSFVMWMGFAIFDSETIFITVLEPPSPKSEAEVRSYISCLRAIDNQRVLTSLSQKLEPRRS